MKAEIIAVGSELTSGAKLDTNSQWLSRQLADVGISVHFHTTVSDDHTEQIAVLRTAATRADVVIVTGGLGPTQDDLTRQVFAEVASVPLELDPMSLQVIEEMFSRRGRTMPERNRIQAMFPAGSAALPNPIGTAPGIWLELPRDAGQRPCLIAALPGVPSEMHRMFEEQVQPRLPASGVVIRRALVHCFGLGESHVEELLGEVTARGRDPEVGITAHEATITLRIDARGADEVECLQKIDITSLEIRQRLGHYVFGADDDVIETVVIGLLQQANRRLASIEIATGGLLSERLTQAAVGDRSYAGGLVLGSVDSWPPLLGDLRRQTADGAGDEQTVRDLAETAHRLFGVDLGLAVGACRRVDGVLQEPATYVALATEGDVRSLPVPTVGNSSLFAPRTASLALDLVRLALWDG